jgi:hypothetical protein
MRRHKAYHVNNEVANDLVNCLKDIKIDEKSVKSVCAKAIQ